MSLTTQDIRAALYDAYDDRDQYDPEVGGLYSHLSHREYRAMLAHEAREAEARAALAIRMATPVSRPTPTVAINMRARVYSHRPPPPTRRELYHQAKAAGIPVVWSGPKADDWDSLARKLKQAGITV